ncbi:bifunctional diguanylate cyclase/phosphodiesterase [Pseudoalteromonas spongiae]|uniref:sensor domain-containing protein n=1 Tax=Pseudoalteromonas spongiae TaxID=298657 RepID=UPI000C2D4E3B|nr:bifunctional diguanylate cyclase/phosphodiesterase [Pseudoalteromonas spongiae]
MVRKLSKGFAFNTKAVLQHVPIGLFVAKPTGECMFANNALYRVLSLTNTDIVGSSYINAMHPDDRQKAIKHWYACTAKGANFQFTFRSAAKTKNKLLSIHAEPLIENKVITAYIGIVEDVTTINETERKLYLSQQRYELAAKGASAGVWDWDISNNEVFYSTKFTELLGFDNLAFGCDFASFTEQIHPDDIKQFKASLEVHLADPFEAFDIEVRMYSAKQQELWFHIVGEAMRDEKGNPYRMVGSMSDITEKKQSQQVIWHQANFDALTQLPNRNMFTDRLNQEIAKSKRSGDKFALLFIDLDHFKEVNDTMGHNAGDLLLVEVSERLKIILRETDTVARIGGDEFTALLCNIHNLADVENIASKLIQAIEMPFYINNESIFISASIGITLFPDHSEKMEELLRFADQAMYLSKEEGRKQYRHFNKTLQEKSEKAHLLTQELRLAVINQQLEVLYQPILSISDLKIHKAEALLRWHHPELGMVSPADFIPLAETSGMIIDIGNWVFQQAAEQVKTWQSSYDQHFQISVNRSPAQFQSSVSKHDVIWLNTLLQLSLKHGICIEITEGLLLDDNEEIKETLKKFRSAGVAISLDDFGTGYAALSYLTKFELDFLKIDRAFVMNLESSAQNQALCEAIIVMAHKLGLKVIAEGVETQEQLFILEAAGCDYAQGYFVSKPISHLLFERELASQDPFSVQQKLKQTSFKKTSAI